MACSFILNETFNIPINYFIMPGLGMVGFDTQRLDWRAPSQEWFESAQASTSSMPGMSHVQTYITTEALLPTDHDQMAKFKAQMYSCVNYITS